MKTINIFVLSTLLISASTFTSCKKEETKPTTPISNTTGITNGGTPKNPLADKLTLGFAIITIDGITDTIKADEFFLELGAKKLFGILHTPVNGEETLNFITGDTLLPNTDRMFSINKNVFDTPKVGEVALILYDESTDEDIIGQGGTVSYMIGATEKVIKFSNIIFKAEEDTTIIKKISYEARLK